MDALQDPAVDIDLKHAIKGAQFKIASGYLMAAHEPGLPAHERAIYMAMHRQARDRAAEDGVTPLCIIQHNEWGCAEPDASIGSIEHQFDRGGLSMEIGQGRQVPQDESYEAITGRATVRYAAFLREELDRLPATHPLHLRYSGQLGRLECQLGPVAPASSRR